MRFRCRAAAALAALVLIAAPAAAQSYYGGDSGSGGPGGYGGGYGPGMMGPGGGWMGPGMMGGYGPGYGGGYGPGMMGPGMMGGGWGGNWGNGWGSGWNGPRRDLHLSVADVTSYMQRWLAVQDDPHVKLGRVAANNADTITADIVTVDNGSLVERFLVNRHTGAFRPE